MLPPGKQLSLTRRGLCFSAAFSFLFFLVFSAPHRVHHFFEQTSAPQAAVHLKVHNHSEHTNHSGQNRSLPTSKPGDCAVLSAAQTAHASLVAPFSLPNLERTANFRDYHFATAIPSRHFSLASPRAPPLI
jgi:hypothetical protein